MTENKLPERAAGLTRRGFIKGVGLASGAVAGALSPPRASGQDTPPVRPGITRHASTGTEVVLRINGKRHRLTVRPSDSLLEVLRERLNLNGSKEVCGRGSCGACTILVNGRSVNSCLMLAVDAAGADLRTVEGLAEGDRLSPIQQAFVQHDACQCGYCIPGFVVRSTALLRENPRPSKDEIRKGLSGNVCRCGAYVKIFEAVESAAKGGAA